MENKERELAIFQQIQPLQVFQDNKADDFLNGVKKEVEEFKKTRDISTPKGRAEIKSFAFKIAQTKAPLDKAGLSLTEEMRDKVKLINAERARIKETLESLQSDVRQPLTDFENKEKKRIEDFEDRIKDMESYRGQQIDSPKSANDFMIDLNSLYNNVKDWQEFANKAKSVYEDVNLYLSDTRNILEKREVEQLELEKLRKEKEERDLREREEQIAREATQKAERIAREESERKAKIAEDEKYRLEAEKKALELAKIEAEKRRDQEIKEAAEREIQAKIQAEKDKEEAITKERLRNEAVKMAEEKATKERAQNLAHKTKIYNEIIAALLPYVNNNMEVNAKTKAIIAGIAKGKVPYLSINF